jgi:hypothetical protein
MKVRSYLTPPAGAWVCAVDSSSSVGSLAAIDCALISARYSGRRDILSITILSSVRDFSQFSSESSYSTNRIYSGRFPITTRCCSSRTHQQTLGRCSRRLQTFKKNKRQRKSEYAETVEVEVEVSSSRGDEDDDTEADEGDETDETDGVSSSVDSSIRGL